MVWALSIHDGSTDLQRLLIGGQAGTQLGIIHSYACDHGETLFCFRKPKNNIFLCMYVRYMIVSGFNLRVFNKFELN